MLDDMANSSIIRVPFPEATLKKKLREHLHALGFQRSTDGALELPGSGKEVIRSLHRSQRRDRHHENHLFLAKSAPALIEHFASGREITPSKITPRLERVYADTWQSDLFRMASLTWSIPVSRGFGRRLRYIVWDESNQKLIGLIAIGDPVFNLAVRDEIIGWDVHDRSARLVNMMDAYVLGSLPPYSSLLGGKMVASLIRTREIYDEFKRTYGARRGIISQQNKKARLVAVTTTSAMGRSSVYNRLKLRGEYYFLPVGYTYGWGHFHIPDSLFSELRDYLRRIGHPYTDLHRFGHGPNWRLRTTRAALAALGFRQDLLRHGIQREVFISFLASNAIDILRTGQGHPDISSLLSVNQVAALALNRWIIPRSRRRPEFRNWIREDIMSLFENRESIMQDRVTQVS